MPTGGRGPMYSITSSPAPHHVVAPTRVNAPVPTLGVRWSGGTERAAAKLGHGAMTAHVKVCAMQLWAQRVHMQMKIIQGMRAPSIEARYRMAGTVRRNTSQDSSLFIYVVSIILLEKTDMYKPRFCSFLVCEQEKIHTPRIALDQVGITERR